MEALDSQAWIQAVVHAIRIHRNHCLLSRTTIDMPHSRSTSHSHSHSSEASSDRIHPSHNRNHNIHRNITNMPSKMQTVASFPTRHLRAMLGK